jgi:hypothetical protein
MDARLILVLAALLVGTSGATPTKLPDLKEQTKGEKFKFYHYILDEDKPYAHLANINDFSKESGCKRDKFESLSKICDDFEPSEREYCDRVAAKFVEKHKAECGDDLRAVLLSSIGKDRLETIENFEAGLAQYIKNGGLEELPSHVTAKMFAFQPNRLKRELESLVKACRVYDALYDRELSFFEKSRDETLKQLAESSRFGRGLKEAMEDCETISRINVLTQKHQ